MENPYKYTDPDEEHEREPLPEEISLWYTIVRFFIPLILLIITPSVPIVIHELIYKIDHVYLFCLFSWIFLVWPMALVSMYKYLWSKDRK